MLNFTVITIFPQMLSSPLGHSILKKAQENGLIKFDIVDLRNYATDRHRTTDDAPYGGGQGMVMKPAAVVVIDAVARLIPGVLGNENSSVEESFTDGLLEYPQFTRPEEFRGMKVPDVLLSGDHERIKTWRREQSLSLTRERRPDLFAKAAPSGRARAH